jgi:hypothetical protein
MEHECNYCLQTFKQKRNLREHQKNRPSMCIEVEKRLKKFEARLTKPSEPHLTRVGPTYEHLTRVGPTLMSFQSIFVKAQEEYTLETLKKYIEMNAEGDILIFKELFITPERSIRVVEGGGDKYEIYDGNKWVVMKLRDIVTMVMNSLATLYNPVIKEKHRLLDEVDKKYPRWSGNDAVVDKNMQEYNNITDNYISATHHRASLISNDVGLHNEIKNGIKSLLNN